MRAKRQRLTLQRGDGRHVWLSGRRLLNFASNNYLGLAGHPGLLTAFADAARRHGMSACASQFVAGYTAPLQALEEDLAAFTGRERAAVFSSGYLANQAAVTALAGRGALVAADRLAHASLIDAARLSRCTLWRYPHADSAALDQYLQSRAASRRMVLSDGVFSMDGDIAPARELSEVCRRRDALLLLDDAHGIGVLGAAGGGVLEHCGLEPAQVPLLSGTFGKAMGLSGAFVAGSAELLEEILQTGRSALYTTALAPGLAAAARAALGLLQAESWRRVRLAARIAEFRAARAEHGLSAVVPDSETPIQPVLIGDEEKCLALSAGLRAAGFLVPAIRPPTVPHGSSRLRISLSAAHEEQDVVELAAALADGLVDPALAQISRA